LAIKLYRCSQMFVKIKAHPCWNVQKALDDAGIEYELVKGPLRRGKRDDLERISGQRTYPTIQFEDGSTYREESRDMVARIKEGKLFAGQPAMPPPPAMPPAAPPSPSDIGGSPPAP
jgi:hypothetical protein